MYSDIGPRCQQIQYFQLINNFFPPMVHSKVVIEFEWRATYFSSLGA
jgi:hypothetical protein